MATNSDPRFQALLPLWSWLPAFRAIAETEHLPSAAELCGVGPSSLSRSLALLERAVGRPLFTRTGRALRLDEGGRVLLSAVRDAMRRIDDGLAELSGDGFRGPLRIASGGAGTTSLVAPALEQLRRAHPAVVPQLVTRPPDEVADELLRGTLDVAFQEAPMRRQGLVVFEVGRITRAVYCGRRHALFARSRVTADDLVDGEFVAPPAAADGAVPDGWPAELRRRVTWITDQLRVGLEICVAQPLLAVLPDALAAAHGDALRRLTAVPIPPSPVFAIYRRPVSALASPAATLAGFVRAAEG